MNRIFTTICIVCFTILALAACEQQTMLGLSEPTESATHSDQSDTERNTDNDDTEDTEEENNDALQNTVATQVAATLTAIVVSEEEEEPTATKNARTESNTWNNEPTKKATTERESPTPNVNPMPTAPARAGQSVGNISPVSANVPASFKGTTSGAPKGTFASFKPPKTQQSGSIASYTLAPDLSNVELTVLLSAQQRARIAKTGFVVSPNDTLEFYECYERLRYDYIPAFITTDSILHVYHLLFDKTLRSTETQYLIPMLTRLDWEMLNTSVAQYDELNGTAWGEAARRNAAYFAVAVALLNSEWSIPDGLEDLVEPDLDNIQAQSGIAPSAIFPAQVPGEDWSQYIPRGHYTKSEALTRYFQAMMWHGRMTFRAEDAIETQQAALLTLALQQTTVDGHPARDIWAGIYEPTTFFVGRSDDLTPTEYTFALETAYGQVDDVQELIDEAAFANFQEAVQNLRPPEIMGMVLNEEGFIVRDMVKGLRFMGQHLVPDAMVFQNLTNPLIPERMMPKALDFFAALGSKRALQHLKDSGDTDIQDYMENMLDMQETFANYDTQTWNQNLYWSWIYSLLPLLDPPDQGYPQCMYSDAWLDKQLTTSLGSWTELKRDTILYAKQAIVEGGANPLMPPDPEPPKGYVEPMPSVYARVVALTEMTREGLDSRGLLHEDDAAALDAMVDIANTLQTIAEKELRNETLTEDEYEFIRAYGKKIELLTFAAADEVAYHEHINAFPTGDEPLQAAVVADVATNPNSGLVLEEGVGRVFDIYVVVPIENRLVLAKGGVFSHYEFTQPLNSRLTDAQWRTMLDSGNTPSRAPWTDSFIIEEQADQVLAETIRSFNDALVRAFWYTNHELVDKYLGEEEMRDTSLFIKRNLEDHGHFMGSKRYSLQFQSFDFQDARHATVTTREVWQDTLYSGDPMQWEAEKLQERGPYGLRVTYTMEQQDDDTWLIMRIVLKGEVPEWEDVRED